MANHHFTLIVEGPDMQAEEIVDVLFESGCDDGTVGRSQGIQFVVFDREADNLAQAVLTAVGDIERVPDLKVVRIADAGLVSMADIASRSGRTRESVRLLVSGARGPGGFPSPVTDPRSRYRLWRWSEVERWLREYANQATGSSDDRLLAAINAGLEFRHYASSLDARLRSRVRSMTGLP
ncbi:MAG: hypothetical protein OXI90_14705 [Gammaproteobacteria bacterium]|nr:hypothetical protein [Gammaproteobacteria bacterium]